MVTLGQHGHGIEERALIHNMVQRNPTITFILFMANNCIEIVALSSIF